MKNIITQIQKSKSIQIGLAILIAGIIIFILSYFDILQKSNSYKADILSDTEIRIDLQSSTTENIPPPPLNIPRPTPPAER